MPLRHVQRPQWLSGREMKWLWRTIVTVLWSLAGLSGGRRAAEKRTEGVGLLPLVIVAFALVVLFVLALVLLTRIAASA